MVWGAAKVGKAGAALASHMLGMRSEVAEEIPSIEAGSPLAVVVSKGAVVA